MHNLQQKPVTINFIEKTPIFYIYIWPEHMRELTLVKYKKNKLTTKKIIVIMKIVYFLILLCNADIDNKLLFGYQAIYATK